jgi:hypothetical protein
MSNQYGAIVIGSGHNGLTCACYLAKAGTKVLVLEQYASIGGMTNPEELTLPGFHSDTHAIGYQMANLSPLPHELGLHRYGFELLHPEIGFSQAFPDGTSISVFRDIERTCDSIARFSARDADAWRTLCSRFAAAADQIAAAIHSPPPSPAEQMLAFEASPDGLDEYRFQLQSFRSWARETFEAEQTKLLLGTWCCHVGLAPDDAGGAGVAWMFSGLIQQYGNNLVKGGMRNLPLALAGFLGAHGGEIRTHARGAMNGTQRSILILPQLRQIAEQAITHPDRVFTSLIHRMDFDFLREAFFELRRDGAPGLSGITVKDYEKDLEANLKDLHERLAGQTYGAPPIKRVWIDKDNGKKRPIGLVEIEDKIVQKAVSMLMGAVCEQDFLPISCAFGKGATPTTPSRTCASSA